jgi:hypothetical protein
VAHLFGPEGTDAPLYVRNDIDCYDCRLAAGATTTLPSRSGRHTYLYVFDGAVEVDDETVGFTESGFVTIADDVAVTATEDATIIAFSLEPDAPITRQGTIGR